MRICAPLVVALALVPAGLRGDDSVRRGAGLPGAGLPEAFRWVVSPPLLAPVGRPDDPCFSVKDPTVVYHGGRWHLFCTIRSAKRTHQVEYLSFADWKDADAAERHVLKLSDGYFCAPQVFYFTPHRKWYMILQVPNPQGLPVLAPAYSTSDDLSDPGSWTKPVPLYPAHPPNVKGWIDFWVICDGADAHLFFTANDGTMWRAGTRRADFPHGWDAPRVVLRGDIFEGSCTYKLKGTGQYLTLVEAETGRAPAWRYYKAYVSDALDGAWTPVADTPEKPFAGLANVAFPPGVRRWTDSISHGELLRAGVDEKLEVDPADLRFLFQGVPDADRRGRKYGEIPWRLGLLEPAAAKP